MTDLPPRAASLQRLARRRLRRVPVIWFFAAASLILALVLTAGSRFGRGETTAAAIGTLR